MTHAHDLQWADLPAPEEEDGGILPDINIDIDIDPPFSGGDGSGSLIEQPAADGLSADAIVTPEALDLAQSLVSNLLVLIG